MSKLASFPDFLSVSFYYEVGTGNHCNFNKQKPFEKSAMLLLLVHQPWCMKGTICNKLTSEYHCPCTQPRKGGRLNSSLTEQRKKVNSEDACGRKSVTLTVPAQLLDTHPPCHHNACSRRPVPILAVQTQSHPARSSASTTHLHDQHAQLAHLKSRDILNLLQG